MGRHFWRKLGRPRLKCIFKHRNGRQCRDPHAKDSKYCFMHDPEKCPVYFIKDYERYSHGDSLLDISREVGEGYIALGVAIRYDQAVADQMRKNVKAGLKEYEKILALYIEREYLIIKKHIVERNEAYFEKSFSERPWAAESFIACDVFTKEEKAYLKKIFDRVEKKLFG